MRSGSLLCEYVNPLNNQRYYLGRPDDAYALMRSLGLGVSNTDINSFLVKAPVRLAGRILLQVQDKGQAYYVDPVQLKLYYLGRPADAFQVMRTRGLGISNADLNTIAIASLSPVSPSESTTTSPSAGSSSVNNDQSKSFTFKYQNNSYELILPLSTALYNSYSSSPKVYTYTVGNEPSNLRDVFYALFLKTKTNDASIDEIVTKLKKVAADNNWTDDQLLEFVVSFVQFIPYDSAKVVSGTGENTNPYFPYETLYLDKGVCSDKTFLGVVLLRKLGYGAAILDFPDINHTALGVSCPKEYSINNSGYCYAETTNYFPLGVIPQSINNGQAQTATEYTNLFNTSHLGKIEIYQATTGKVYGGIPALQSRIDYLNNEKLDIDARKTEINALATPLTAKQTQITTMRDQMDTLYNEGKISAYNQMIPTFNALVAQYNSDLAVYQAKVNEYNAKINEFNTATHAFYQQ